MINKIFLILALSVNLFAVDLVYPNGKIENFIPLKSDRSFVENVRTYLKNDQKYEDTRVIYISFGKNEDLKEIAKKYNLEFIKFTNQNLNTALFQLNDQVDIVKLCSQINQNENIRYAKPNWKRVRLLR